MWVPVDTARRTVRSARSPYTSWPERPALRHRSVSRSMTARDGSRATMAPLSAPTLVPSTRSGTTPRSKRARSIPTSTAPRTPPPPSTNAVVTDYAAGASSGCSARTFWVTRCSTQKIRIGIRPAASARSVKPSDQRARRERKNAVTT